MASQCSLILSQFSLKIFEKIANNLHKLSAMGQSKEKLHIFLSRFPFDKMLEVNVLDLETLSYCVKILNFLHEFPEFYEAEFACKSGLEFLMLSLGTMDQNRPEVIDLLNTLNKMLVRLASNSKQALFAVDPERLLEIIVKVTTLTGFDRNTASHCNDIVQISLNMSEELPFSTDAAVLTLFRGFEKVDAYDGMCILVEWLIYKFNLLRTDFQDVFSWVINKCPLVLNQQNEDSSVMLKILNCLSSFMKIHDNYNCMKMYNIVDVMKRLKAFFQNLIIVSGNLCSYSSMPEAREICLQLLEQALVEFFTEEELPTYKMRQICKELANLPDNPQLWPQADSNIFLCICYMLVNTNNELLWTKEEVAECISRIFYNKRTALDVYALKAIFFLYPLMAEDIGTTKFSVTGYDLLRFLAAYQDPAHVYSYNDYQLKWILSNGSHSLKMNTLRRWLQKIDCNESLMRAMRSSNGGKYLLRLLLEDCSKDTTPKLVYLLKHGKDDEVAQQMALMLGIAADRPHLFNSLLLAEPGIPLESENSIAVCTLMGIMMTSLNDASVLKGACVYSSKLLASMQANPESIRQFCMDLRLIDFLVDCTTKVDEETCVEIIRLFSVLITIQKQTGVEFDNSLSYDFRPFFKGTNFKIIRSLKLLLFVLTCDNCFMQISNTCILSIYFKIWSLGFENELGALAYTCLSSIFQKYRYLAKTAYTCVYVEMVCNASADFVHIRQFLKALKRWMVIVKSNENNGFCAVPTDAIRSLLLRASVPSKHRDACLSLLKDVERNFCFSLHLKQQTLRLAYAR